ncbi:YdeI family stress tolerance OB fold protein [Klebsiella oxytoca]|uniref:YdeI family stress tolerance OB fold protein n=1 Tax=Klebsiella oxytoca TaxID=571 RepID=A0A6B8MPS4_KLEOX|nr:YdeI family stress tolerance OB fold protein [Klebsiella oxytoca]QGN38402.1 YdeI family stress tolerance OB fold protein [Klebsiella oxytoca]
MKKLLLCIFCSLMVPGVYAADEGGFQKDAAPPPPHKIDDGYRGTEDARIMTVRQAQEMHDGATISLRGNLIEQHGEDRYRFRDKTGTISVIIPAAVFNGREVKPDRMIGINGSLDKKMTPPVVRVDRIEK